MPDYPGFFGGSYPSAAFSTDNEQAVNLFVEKNQSLGAKGPASLLSTPGFQRWSGAGVTDLVGRAAIVARGRLFMVIGAGFYEFDAAGVPTKRGAVTQNSNPAQLAFNGVVGGHVLVASGSNGYCFVLATNAFTQVLTGDCDQIAYATGFFLAFSLTTAIVRESALNDGTTWPGAQFFQRSLFADPWQSMFTDGNGLVWLVGTESFEVWQNTGIGTQPFAPLSGLQGLFGIAAPFAFALAPAPAWLVANRAGSATFIVMAGSQPSFISNYAVSNQLSIYARQFGIGDAEVLTYQDGGHTFLIPSFPSANATWAVDVEGQGWAERGKWNAARGAFDLWAPRCHAYAFGKHLVGDRATGAIWQMDASFGTDVDGQGIRRLRRTPALVDELKRHPVDRFQLLVDTGIAPAVDPGSDPKLMLRCSNTGGRTWGNQRLAGFGRQGEFKRRVYWTRCGQAENLSFEVTCSDPVPLRISGAWLNPTEAELEQAA
jgi:hypothetical protein